MADASSPRASLRNSDGGLANGRGSMDSNSSGVKESPLSVQDFASTPPSLPVPVPVPVPMAVPVLAVPVPPPAPRAPPKGPNAPRAPHAKQVCTLHRQHLADKLAYTETSTLVLCIVFTLMVLLAEWYDRVQVAGDDDDDGHVADDEAAADALRSAARALPATPARPQGTVKACGVCVASARCLLCAGCFVLLC